MSSERDGLSDVIELGSAVIKEESLKVEFKLKLQSGERVMVKYSEQKLPDQSVGHATLEIDLGGGLQGSIFKVGGGDSVGSVFTKQKGISLPFQKRLGDALRERFGPGLVQAFADYLSKEEYGLAGILWQDALAMTSG